MQRQDTDSSTDSRKRAGKSIVFVRLNQSVAVVDDEQLSHISQGKHQQITFATLTDGYCRMRQPVDDFTQALENYPDDRLAEVWTSGGLHVGSSGQQGNASHVGEEDVRESEDVAGVQQSNFRGT